MGDGWSEWLGRVSGVSMLDSRCTMLVEVRISKLEIRNNLNTNGQMFKTPNSKIGAKYKPTNEWQVNPRLDAGYLNRRQKAENRGRTTEDRRQRTEDISGEEVRK